MNTSSAYNYEIYGLNIRANMQLPGLAEQKPGVSGTDININLGALPTDLFSSSQHTVEKYYVDNDTSHLDVPHVIVNTLDSGNFFHFCYDDGTEFICNRQATEVWGTWIPPYVSDDTVLYLLGPILGFMLRLRGITCLHASAVVINNKAIAFTGNSGSGKSTLAAAFAAQGIPVLTDDVLPVVNYNGVLHALPGYPRLRLYPESAQNLKDLPDELPKLSLNEYKCYLDLSANPYQFYSESIPLDTIYILDWNLDENESTSIIQTMQASEAMITLIANTYRNELLDNQMKQAEFDFLGMVISNVKVKKILPADDLQQLDKLVALIIQDLENS